MKFHRLVLSIKQIVSRMMSEHASNRTQLEAMMQRALERKEFVLHYQPKFEAQTLRIEGVAYE